MKIRRNTGGFALLELMLAVALLSVLMGLGAVNVIRYQRTLTQVELDGIAREIFVAAQNHLTMAESQGFMGVSEYGTLYEDEGTEAPGIYYYVVNNRNASDMLNLMLPFAAVDETVLSGGSYIIIYQKEPARVLDVFYAFSKSGRFTHKFTRDEVLSLVNSFRGDANRESRGHYRYEGEDTVIGWYGAGTGQKGSRGINYWTFLISFEPGYPENPEDPNNPNNPENPENPEDPNNPNTPVPKGERLYAPVIKLVNAERLYVDVVNPNTSEKALKAGLRLIVEGKQSGETCVITLRASEANPTQPIPSKFHVVLDDVTSEGQHFHDVCGELSPGEDITVYAEAYNNQELTNIATSNKETENSLFASLDERPDKLELALPFAAKIANFRHLENLDSAVSGIEIKSPNGNSGGNYYRISPPENSEKLAIQIDYAEQTKDMDWEQFLGVVGERAKVSTVDGTSVSSNPGCYLPITNGGIIKYNGNGLTISNVKIDAPGNAGLFATLGNESTVSDLQLVNFDVQSSGGAAGALAGVLQDGSTVSGVLARHEKGKTSEIKSESNASVGGLVGKIEGAATVEQSAAAVYVTSTNGDAGGLIGAVAIDNDAQVIVKDSYAGGHTQEGKYEKDHTYNGNNYYNVASIASNGNAGGLIGSASGAGTLSVTNCYSTASVEGATAGGFIGSVTEGTITNCYATGYVTGSGNLGAFAGVADTANFSDDGYFSAVTGDLSAVGNKEGEVEGISELDGQPAAYGAGRAQSAAPYDEFLKTTYRGMYAFRTIKELNKERTTPGWMSLHYGDWPPLDTLVINER